MRPKFIAGNWKMNGSLSSISILLNSLIKGIEKTNLSAEIAVFPPFLYLEQVKNLLSDTTISWGSQNISEYQSGAYTGEISGQMLKDFNCKYAIVGHSERRTIYNESDITVSNKTIAAINSGICPIICVGETLSEREHNKTRMIIERQLQAVISKLPSPLPKIIIAYEPVWAIGTGKNATPDQAQEVHNFIRSQLAYINTIFAEETIILYGGSMKPSNAHTLLAMPDIDGGLVGGASLDAAEFLKIIES